MYKVGYLNGENATADMSVEKFQYLIDTMRAYDGFFLSEVKPEGLVDRLVSATGREAFYGSGRTQDHTVWFFGKPGMFQAGPNTSKYEGDMEFSGGSYERFACVTRGGVSLFGVHLKRRPEEYGSARKSLEVLVNGVKALKAQAALLMNVVNQSGRCVCVGDFNATHSDRVVKLMDKSFQWRPGLRHRRPDVDHCFTKDVSVDCSMKPCRYSDHPLVSVEVLGSSWRRRGQTRKRSLADMMLRL